MSFDQDNRIAHFLSRYVYTSNHNPIPAEPRYIKCAIRMLMEENIMTRNEIRKKALSDFEVIIPEEYFPEQEEPT